MWPMEYSSKCGHKRFHVCLFLMTSEAELEVYFFLFIIYYSNYKKKKSVV